VSDVAAILLIKEKTETRRTNQAKVLVRKFRENLFRISAMLTSLVFKNAFLYSHFVYKERKERRLFFFECSQA
jgi:hypothetical protein